MNKIKEFIIYLIIISLILIAFWLGIFNPVENKVYDLLQITGKIFNPVLPREPVLITIDERTISHIGEWPLPRDYYAEAVKKLKEAEATAIGIDVIFDSRRKGDEEFIDVLKDSENVILPMVLDLTMTRGLSQNSTDLTINDIDEPLDLIRENAELGHINFIPDRDGIIRSLYPLMSFNEREIPSFSLALAEKKKDFNFHPFAEIKLNFTGPSETLPHISFIDLLENNYEPEFFKNKIVIIGVKASGLGDRYMTSFSRYGYLSGIELNGQAVYNLINDNYIKTPIFAGKIIIITVFLLLNLIIIIRSPLLKLKPLFYLLSIYTFIQLILYYSLRIYVPLATPILGGITLDTTAYITQYFSSEKEKKIIKKLFSRYVSREIFEELISSPDEVELGGEEKELTILFVDINNFTEYSKNVSPERAVKDLNITYDKITKIIKENRGTIDKYLGDGLLSFFGAPIKYKDSASRALRAAVDIQQLSDNREIPFKLSVGMESGPVLVGNIGSEDIMDYTVIGTAVNRAAHFVEIAGPDEIIAGQKTWNILSKTEKDWLENKYNIKGNTGESFICLRREINE